MSESENNNQKLKSYKAVWRKYYMTSGEDIVLASSDDEAANIMGSVIGDKEGSMQYLADDDIIEIFEIKE